MEAIRCLASFNFPSFCLYYPCPQCPREPTSFSITKALQDRFATMDTDNSGTLSMSEFIGFWEGLRGALSNEEAYKQLLEDCIVDFNISVRICALLMSCIFSLGIILIPHLKGPN